MTEPLNITTERVDDIPLLLAHSDKMGVPELLDDYFKPHGNWEGMSLGWTTAIWLTHILEDADHRMNQVQGWAAHRVQTLCICTGQEVSERGLRDDRLALVLDALSDEQKWQQFETALNRQLIRVYDLKPIRVRVDSTTVSGYWTVTQEGLFQLGYSKDHRPDLPQRKRDAVGLGPLGTARRDADRVGGTRRRSALSSCHCSGEPESEHPRVALRRGLQDGRTGHPGVSGGAAGLLFVSTGGETDARRGLGRVLATRVGRRASLDPCLA